MALEIQNAVVGLILDLVGGRLVETPSWLVRPGKQECKTHWPLAQQVYKDLTGMELPEVVRPVERRTVDAVILTADGARTIVEVDEKQHFNKFRALSLGSYKDTVVLGFDPALWIQKSREKVKLEGGGFAKPKPPLFPGENGRHKQRAFRDALTDILPALYGFRPTVRIADFEVKTWLADATAKNRMRTLLEGRWLEG